MIISTTIFRLKKLSLYAEFFADTYRVVKQVKKAGGIIRMKINPISLRTITVWKTREAMIKFRNSGAHLHAMKKSRSFGQISSVTWASKTIPTWREAIKRMNESEIGK